MLIKKNLTVDIGGGDKFSSDKSGFLFLENAVADKKDKKNPDVIFCRHRDLVAAVLRESPVCAWIVEDPSARAQKDIRARFKNVDEANKSFLGYIAVGDTESISDFLKIAWENYSAEPWANEGAWILVGLRELVPKPEIRGRPAWSWIHLLRNHEKVNSAFIQTGWFSSIMFRPSDQNRALIQNEFNLQL